MGPSEPHTETPLRTGSGAPPNLRSLFDPGAVTLPEPVAAPPLIRRPPEAVPAADAAAPSSWRSFAKVLVAVVVTYTFLFNFSVVRGSSMSPVILDGDRILIDQVSYMFSSVERGDIVVLKYPLDPSVDYIKRVVGLPGDHIELSGGRVWVNGHELVEPYVRDVDHLARCEVEVRPAHYFVLGDNRVRSSDSRDFGQVPMDYVRGKVEVRVWPFSRFGRIH